MSSPEIMEPSACSWCGIARRGHGRQYADASGWHEWEQPSQEQILARMKARRLQLAVARLGALPVSVGAEPSELEQLRARVAELEAERHVTNEALDDAVQELRLRNTQRGDVALLVEQERGHGEECVDIDDLEVALALGSDDAEPDKLTCLLAPTQALREVPDGEHYPTVHHTYRVGHDLPETGGAR